MYCVHKSYIIIYSLIGLICFAVSLNEGGASITITILDIIHRPVFYLKHNVSEAVFCLRLQVEPIQLGPIHRASLCLRFRRQNPFSATMCL
jgi:hypothetical protein